MPDDEQEPMQETPGGNTIPVPKRDDVLAALRKVAKPRPSDDDSAGGTQE